MTRSSAIVRRRVALVGAAVALLALTASGLHLLPVAVAYLLPPALLLLALVACRYPGERALLALIAGRRRERRRTGERSIAGVPRRAMVPRGGRLIASSLAVRPPPLPRPAPS